LARVAKAAQDLDLPFNEDEFAIDPKDWIPALILQADLE
jgi:hypothetical protein